jgi:sigma-54 dependent transcriptional regulator, acetoin dehydrogenase operon transcriptional activator AcoR
MVAEGTFRHDLLARLRGVGLDLIPLRERPEDVALLIATSLRKLAPERADVKLSPEAARALLEHDWPLNVRELEQALAGALALSGTDPILLEHLPPALHETPGQVTPCLTDEQMRHRDELIALLREHRGNLSAVARAAGKGRTQVVRWVSRSPGTRSVSSCGTSDRRRPSGTSRRARARRGTASTFPAMASG